MGTVMRKAFLGIAGLLFLAGSAQAASCLRLDYIHDWKRLSGGTMEVGDDFGHRYKVTLTGSCKALNLKHALEVHSLAGQGMTCMSPGDILTSQSRVSFSTSHCAVAHITDIAPGTPAPPVSPRRGGAARPSPALDAGP
jgi:hypothetical protein